MIGFPGSARKISIADAIRQIPGTFVAGCAGQHDRRQHEQEEIWSRKIQKVTHQVDLLRRHGGLRKKIDESKCARIRFWPSGGSGSIGLIADYEGPWPFSRGREIVNGDFQLSSRQAREASAWTTEICESSGPYFRRQ
jgi:hypothetical protein